MTEWLDSLTVGQSLALALVLFVFGAGASAAICQVLFNRADRDCANVDPAKRAFMAYTKKPKLKGLDK